MSHWRRRSLFRSPSTPTPVSRPSAKRPDCPSDETTPIRVKRRRSLAGSHVTSQEQNPESPRAVSRPPVPASPPPGRTVLKLRPFVSQGVSLLQRSKSFCQTDIEKLLDSEDGSNQLIGDFTKVRTGTDVPSCLVTSASLFVFEALICFSPCSPLSSQPLVGDTRT